MKFIESMTYFKFCHLYPRILKQLSKTKSIFHSDNQLERIVQSIQVMGLLCTIRCKKNTAPFF